MGIFKNLSLLGFVGIIALLAVVVGVLPYLIIAHFRHQVLVKTMSKIQFLKEYWKDLLGGVAIAACMIVLALAMFCG